MEIRIVSKEINSNDIKEYLENILGEEKTQVKLELRPTRIRLRGLDPTIVVAIVSAAGGALSVLLAGMLDIAKERNVGQIIIRSKEGAEVEVPADFPMEKIDELVVKVRSMDVIRVEI